MSTPMDTPFAAFAQTVRTKASQGRLSPEEAQHLLSRLHEYVADVPPEEVNKLIVQLSSVVLAAGGRLGGQTVNQGSEASNAPVPEDRLLTVEEAAKRMNVKPRWLYANRKRLPFARKLSRKALRFSERGLLRWLERGGSASASKEWGNRS